MMCGSPTTQAVFTILRAFVACGYAYMLQVHTLLQVGLACGRGGARSAPSCPPSQSSGAKVHVQPSHRGILSLYMLHRLLSHNKPLQPYIAVYHWKLHLRTIRLNLMTNHLLKISPSAFDNYFATSLQTLSSDG